MPMRRRLSTVCAPSAFVVVLLSGCGGGGSTGPGTVGSAFKASIDGVNWASTTSSAVSAAGGIFTIVGSQVGASVTSMSLTFYSIGVPGTYPLGVTGTVAGGIATITASPSTWSTPLTGAAGTVTISAVSATRIAGTFSYSATPQLGQAVTTTRVVTNGEFDVPVNGAATLVVPDGASNKVTGTIAGNPFNAATVVSVTAPSSGTLTIAGSNTAYTVNFIISGYTGTATYALGTGASRTIQVTSSAPSKVWGGTNATSAGTVVITSVTSTRIKGTFTATLQPSVINPNEPPITISGSFEKGLP
ncbi:MAG: hypothetical protein IPP90_07760 [Gemmatimonadaceae bacterium]|nr:hypothetical protein [Gemmatimonadaceae bacterium]